MKRLIILLLLLGFLGVKSGYVAIYRDDGSQSILPYRICLFPEKDQTALKTGIPFHSPQELIDLLQDYLS